MDLFYPGTGYRRAPGRRGKPPRCGGDTCPQGAVNWSADRPHGLGRPAARSRPRSGRGSRRDHVDRGYRIAVAGLLATGAGLDDLARWGDDNIVRRVNPELSRRARVGPDRGVHARGVPRVVLVP